MWTANLPTQRLLCAAMFACLCWAFAEMSLSMSFGWPHTLSTVLLAFLVFAAGISLGGRDEGRAYRRYTDYSLLDWALLLIPIVLILKLTPYLLQGPAVLVDEIASWRLEPWRFWDVTLVWSLLLIFMVWDQSIRIAEELGRLSFQPGEAEVAPLRTPGGLPPAEIEGVYAWSRPAAGADEEAAPQRQRFRSWDRSPFRFVSHARAWRQLMWTFVVGGFIVLIFAGLSLVTVEELGDPTRVELPGVIPSVLLYYVLGLIFASQTSLDRLRAEWLRVGVQVQPGLARRWLSYGLALMVAALFLSLLLPTRFIDDDGLLTGGGGVLGFITAPLRIVLGAVFGALSWVLAHVAAFLFAPIAALLPQGEAGSEGRSPPPPPPQQGDEVAQFPSAASQVVWGFLFYVLPGALALYALWNTWQKRRAIWKGVREFFRDIYRMLWGAILDAVAAVWRLLGAVSPGILRGAPEAIKQRWKQRPGLGGVGASAGWLRLRGLSPRELIQYFYVSLVQRAAGVGWGRHEAQTAYEYSRDLASRMPERASEVSALTEAFVRAKYSRREVQPEDVRQARRPWERLRGELQLRRRANRVASWFGLGRET